MLNFPCCNHDPATSVWCHWKDEQFGRARKAHDCSGFVGCASCHAWLDYGWAGKMDIATVRFYVIRAMQRAFVHLIETGVVTVKLDTPKPVHARPAKPRKPKAERRKVPAGRALTGRGFDKGVTRKFSGQVLYRASTGTTEDTGAGE
jgi:hypothetical protein